MSTAQLNAYRRALQSKVAELTRAIRTRDQIAIEPSSDEIDQLVRATERELALHSMDREYRLHRDLQAALERMNSGGYGICQECEEEISLKRLNAIPWAALCLKCQEQMDEMKDQTDLHSEVA